MKEKDFLKNLTFVIDTREQLPYEFSGRNTKKVCLQVGDYSLEGFENEIALERKSIGDLIGSICQGRERFERELEKSRKLDRFAIICECSFKHLVNGKYTSNMKPAAAIQTLITFSVRYDVHVVYAENRKYAKRYTESFLEKYAREKFRKKEDRVG